MSVALFTPAVIDGRKSDNHIGWLGKAVRGETKGHSRPEERERTKLSTKLSQNAAFSSKQQRRREREREYDRQQIINFGNAGTETSNSSKSDRLLRRRWLSHLARLKPRSKNWQKEENKYSQYYFSHLSWSSSSELPKRLISAFFPPRTLFTLVKCLFSRNGGVYRTPPKNDRGRKPHSAEGGKCRKNEPFF